MFHQGEGVQVEDVHRDDQRCDVGDGDGDGDGPVFAMVCSVVEAGERGSW